MSGKACGMWHLGNKHRSVMWHVAATDNVTLVAKMAWLGVAGENGIFWRRNLQRHDVKRMATINK